MTFMNKFEELVSYYQILQFTYVFQESRYYMRLDRIEKNPLVLKLSNTPTHIVYGSDFNECIRIAYSELFISKEDRKQCKNCKYCQYRGHGSKQYCQYDGKKETTYKECTCGNFVSKYQKEGD